MYEVRYTPAAQKYFKKVKEKGLKTAFKEALTEIQNDPSCGSEKTGADC